MADLEYCDSVTKSGCTTSKIDNCLDKKRGFTLYLSDLCFQVFLVVSGAIGTSIETVFGSRVRFTCPEGQVFATGVEVIDTVCMPGGKWSQSYIPKCQEVMTSTQQS